MQMFHIFACNSKQRPKRISPAVWLLILMAAAYFVAQAAVLLIQRRLDAPLAGTVVVQETADEAPAWEPRPHSSQGSKDTPRRKTGGESRVRVARVSDRHWIVDRASVLATTQDINQILKQARAVPYKTRNRIAGFQITAISSGSLYQRIGLRVGDVLLQVNNRALMDQAKLLTLVQEMKDKESISLLILRNGKQQLFTYDIRHIPVADPFPGEDRTGKAFNSVKDPESRNIEANNDEAM